MGKPLFTPKEEKPKTKTNFSCILDTKKEFNPFQKMADSVGLDKTSLFRLILRKEIKDKTVVKSILGNK